MFTLTLAHTVGAPVAVAVTVDTLSAFLNAATVGLDGIENAENRARVADLLDALDIAAIAATDAQTTQRAERDITGYRTNPDHTQTLAWEEREDGSVVCDHDRARACDACVGADSRLAVTPDGSVVHAYWPANMVRDGRTVRFI